MVTFNKLMSPNKFKQTIFWLGASDGDSIALRKLKQSLKPFGIYVYKYNSYVKNVPVVCFIFSNKKLSKLELEVWHIK